MYQRADEEITLVDTVSYKNLQPGKKYKLTGTLMDKETGEAVKDAEGKEITAETSFKPETADGTVNVTFTFDGSNLAGKTIVVLKAWKEMTPCMPYIQTSMTRPRPFIFRRLELQQKMRIRDTVIFSRTGYPGRYCFL